MGEAFGGKQKQISTTNINPALQTQGYYALGQARSLYEDQTPLVSQYVPISAQREAALQQIYQSAQNNAIPQAALGEYQKTMSGAYLNPDSNPWMQEIVNRSVGAAAGAPVSGYAGAGRFGSGVMANAIADSAQNTAARLWGSNYQAERQNMLSMLGQAGQVQQLQYANPMMAGRVGLEYEQDQANRQAEALRQQQYPYAKLEQFQSYLTGNPLMAESTGTTVATQPFQWGQALLGGIGGLFNPMKSMMPSFGGGE